MSQYRVIGGAPFKGTAPGGTFEADFSDADEARYLARGAIELAGGEGAVAPESTDETPVPDGDGPTSEDDVDAQAKAEAEAKAKADAEEAARVEAEAQARGRGGLSRRGKE